MSKMFTHKAIYLESRMFFKPFWFMKNISVILWWNPEFHSLASHIDTVTYVYEYVACNTDMLKCKSRLE